MTGCTTGIAVQIIVRVLKDATGYDPHGSNTLVEAGGSLTHPPLAGRIDLRRARHHRAWAAS